MWIAVVPLLLGGAYLTLLFLVQRSMLFPMPPPMGGDPDPNAEVVRVKHDGAEAYGLYLAPHTAARPSPLIMFMHGNGELADYWVDAFDAPRRLGLGVLLVEYPGYGAASGSPSEQSITDATRALFDWAANDPRIDSRRIVAYGRSLGGGAAVRLALDRPIAALILESAFTSVADFAARFLAPSFLIRDRFDNRKTLALYRGPLLVLHGNQDTIVPFAHGRELASIVPGARFRELDCGHNDCPQDWRTILTFLGETQVLITEDQR
jgi:fermentation-respiration switch protein FrsA (DUF1100 family)